jgi:tetratricopeptide (TPR) repeat protein
MQYLNRYSYTIFQKISIGIIFFTLFIFLSSISLSAQQTPDETVKKIYTEIANAMGLVDYPDIYLDPDHEGSVAFLSYADNKIVFEMKAFRLCESFGERMNDAIAFILGHELAHYKYGHNWGEEFATSYAMFDIGLASSDEVNTLNNLSFWETQADQMGGIYAYLGGYNTINIGKPLLTKIYNDYGFPEEMEKYPSLTDRINIANGNESRLKESIKVFELGNYALMIDQFELAINCYESVIRRGFGSREVFNNIGVAYTLAAIKTLGPEEVKYAYPIELDIASRVNGNRGETHPDYLKKAVRRFQQAALLDPGYTTALINLGCVYSISRQFDDGVYYAKKALELAKKQNETSTVSNAKTILAILNNQMGNTKEAKDLLETISNDNILAAQNLKIMSGKSLGELPWKNNTIIPGFEIQDDEAGNELQSDESINGINIFSGYIDISDYYILMFDARELIISESENTVLLYNDLGRQKKLIILKTKPGYPGESNGHVKIGDDLEKIAKNYGLPSKIINTRQGLLLMYKSPQIVFFINQENKVENWMVYQTE